MNRRDSGFGVYLSVFKWDGNQPEVERCYPKLPTIDTPVARLDLDMGIACNDWRDEVIDLGQFQFSFQAYWYPGDESDLGER